MAETTKTIIGESVKGISVDDKDMLAKYFKGKEIAKIKKTGINITKECQVVKKQLYDEKSDINWIALEPTKPKKKYKLEVAGYGKGGMDQVIEFFKANGAAKILFCILSVGTEDNAGSKRYKNIFFKHIPSNIGPMQKGRVQTYAADVQDFLAQEGGNISMTKNTSDDDGDTHYEKVMVVEELAAIFLRVGGAHKPDYYIFTPGQKFHTK